MYPKITYGDPTHPTHDEPARRAAVDWLLGRVNYERVAEIPYNDRQLKLDRMRQLLTRLGQPDAGMKIVHVAGTKGKGSTSAMIAGILSAAGYRTGLFTSPHLERIEERFAVDGQACSAAELVALVDRVRPVAAAMDAENDGPTFFEIVTAIALLHFVERQVDAAVLEVGLGGRLDSTNVCLPAVSVITSISFDHTKQLGNTLAAIAREKAGIIKPGVPVVCGVTEAEPQTVIAEIAREHGCRLIQLGREFEFQRDDFGLRISDCGLEEIQSAIRNPKSEIANIEFCYNVPGQQLHLSAVPLAMLGAHQAANAAVALAAVAELRHQGWCISTEAMRTGIGQTIVPGRVEIFRGEPTIVLDVAHNQVSARALISALVELPAPSRRTLVLSISSDKDVRAIVAELVPHFERVIVTQYQENPRAVRAEELATIVRETLPRSESRVAREIAIHLTPVDALAYVRETAIPGELVCVAGSFFLAAEMRPLLRNQN